MKLELDESERQIVLLALARLAVERPGWDDALCRIAARVDNPNERGRPAMMDEFIVLHVTPPEIHMPTAQEE